ncbi:hypothetical protein BDN70DRAFT_888819, partial [Pholiota conissans]
MICASHSSKPLRHSFTWSGVNGNNITSGLMVDERSVQVWCKLKRLQLFFTIDLFLQTPSDSRFSLAHLQIKPLEEFMTYFPLYRLERCRLGMLRRIICWFQGHKRRSMYACFCTSYTAVSCITRALFYDALVICGGGGGYCTATDADMDCINALVGETANK